MAPRRALAVLLDSDAAGVDVSICRRAIVSALLRIRSEPSVQADRAVLRRTTISIAQPVEGPKAVTASLRNRWPRGS
jgi:hypothetical protein